VGDSVIVEQRFDGTIHLRWRDRYLQFEKLGASQPADAAALALGLRPRSRAAAPRSGVTPAPDHPWRNNLKGAFSSQRQ